MVRAAGQALSAVQRALDPAPDSVVLGLSMVVTPLPTLPIADTLVHREPIPGAAARRVAPCSHATFGLRARRRTNG